MSVLLPQVLKAPVGTYEFGANVISERFMMLGRIATDGRLSGRLKYDVLDWLGVKLHMQLSNEPGQSQVGPGSPHLPVLPAHPPAPLRCYSADVPPLPPALYCTH